MFLPAQIAGSPARFLIDTGSSGTIISRDMYERISKKRRPKLSPSTDRMVVADGSASPVLGRIDVEISIGTVNVFHPVIVANIALDAIMGLAFLRSHKGQLDLEGSKLNISGKTFTLQGENAEDFACHRVKLSKTVNIPAFSEMIIPGKLVKRGSVPSVGILEGSNKFAEKTDW